MSRLESSISRAGAAKTQNRRDQQDLEHLDGLLPVHARGANVRIEQLVGNAHADDGTHHGVRTRGRQPEPPGAQVPQDRGDQQRKNHGESSAGAHLNNQFDRQQRDDRKGHRPGGSQHAGQVADSRPHHGDIGLQRVGVDHRGHGVGRVMETIHKFKAQSNQQGQRQQQIGPDAGDRHRCPGPLPR